MTDKKSFECAVLDILLNLMENRHFHIIARRPESGYLILAEIRRASPTWPRMVLFNFNPDVRYSDLLPINITEINIKDIWRSYGY